MLINEVLADPSAIGGDANRDGIVSTLQDEFVELVNTAEGPISLSGWSLWDAVKVRHVFSSDATIPGWGFFVVFGGGSPQGFDHFAVSSQNGLSLNNDGDTISLFDAGGLGIDAFTYGAEGGLDAALTRFPDAVGRFSRHNLVAPRSFSPGATVDGRLTLPTSSMPEPASGLLFTLGLCWPVLRRHRASLESIS